MQQNQNVNTHQRHKSTGIMNADRMHFQEFEDVPLTRTEVLTRCRSLAATALIFAVTIRSFHMNSGYADAFQYHPIFMMIAFVMVLPDVVTSFKRLQRKEEKKRQSGPESTQSLDDCLPRAEVILRHQLAAFAMEAAAAAGFAAVEYVKISNQRPHLISPHGVVGALCGAAILCQMVLGTLLRYVFQPHQRIYQRVLVAHRLTSLTIVMTGMLGIVGGFLSTTYAALIFPSSAVRAAIAFASVGIAVSGLLM